MPNPVYGKNVSELIDHTADLWITNNQCPFYTHPFLARDTVQRLKEPEARGEIEMSCTALLINCYHSQLLDIRSSVVVLFFVIQQSRVANNDSSLLKRHTIEYNSM